MKKITLYLILPIIALACGNEKTKEAAIKESKITNEVIKLPNNLGNMPSYCKPESYKLAQLPNGKFVYLLPHGTIGGTYNTLEDAQIALNKHAKYSYDKWIESCGNDY